MIEFEQQLGEWERARASLSHDVVKNEIMPAVFKLCNVIAGKIEDADFFTSFPSAVIPKITDAICQIESLCSSAEQSLSPRQYFNVFPLSECDLATKSWLPEVVHELWLTNSRLNFRLAVLEDKATKLRRAANQVKHALADHRSQTAKQAAEVLRSAVTAVADELSGLRTILPYSP